MSARQSTSSAAHAHNQQIAPTVPQAIHALAAPVPSLIDAQLPNYLLPCVLDLVRDSTRHVLRRKRKEQDDLREEGLHPPLDKGKGRANDDQDEEASLVEEESRKKIERMGLMVGGYIAEK